MFTEISKSKCSQFIEHYMTWVTEWLIEILCVIFMLKMFLFEPYTQSNDVGILMYTLSPNEAYIVLDIHTLQTGWVFEPRKSSVA